MKLSAKFILCLSACVGLIVACTSKETDKAESAATPAPAAEAPAPGAKAPAPAAEVPGRVEPAYVQAPAERDVYFGTTHGHSSWSIDAFALGNQKYGPEDGYRFARGEAVTHMGGPKVQLKQPLDFFMMTDHSEFMGAAPMFLVKGSMVYDTPIAKLVRDKKMTQAFTEIGDAMIKGTNLPGLSDDANAKLSASVWQKVVANADKYNEPGKFTTFVAYEWTSLPGQANMHRNVIFRDTKAPKIPFTAIDSSRPEDLWTAMEAWRKQGMTMLAISHNGNASLGKMFALHDSDGTFIDAAYAKRRNLNEPLHEAGQTKGTSMAHPLFSPNDEWANFELWNYHLPTGAPVPAMRSNYVREAWKMGLNVERVIGVNPFKLGVEGGSDSHSTINTFEEFNFRGNHASMDETAQKRRTGLPGQKLGVPGGNLFLNPGTLTGAWAESNNRGPIYDAMARKETYATSGTRIKVRFFGGYDYPNDLLKKKDWVKAAYDAGVPMGADLAANPTGKAVPKFAVWAMKSPHSANLDRIQIIKLWSDGVIDYEKIYDVALSDGRGVNPKTGKARPVGNTVDVKSARYTNEIGDVELGAVWSDPDFDPAMSAAYYVRVLEIPTPRWSTYDAVALKLPPADTVPATIQERAWTSPIWYAGVSDKKAGDAADAAASPHAGHLPLVHTKKK
jgi:hypothetical protein